MFTSLLLCHPFLHAVGTSLEMHTPHGANAHSGTSCNPFWSQASFNVNACSSQRSWPTQIQLSYSQTSQPQFTSLYLHTAVLNVPVAWLKPISMVINSHFGHRRQYVSITFDWYVQETPDTPEALACVPTLLISDIPKEASTIPTALEESQGVTLLNHDLFTNDILYMEVALDMRPLPKDLLPLMPLFCRYLHPSTLIYCSSLVPHKPARLLKAHMPKVCQGQTLVSCSS